MRNKVSVSWRDKINIPTISMIIGQIVVSSLYTKIKDSVYSDETLSMV